MSCCGLDFLGVTTLGVAGDAYLEAHPEIERDDSGRPVRGMLLPLTDEEKVEFEREVGKAAPAVAYHGPSVAELRKRGPSTYNDAERYWIAEIEGNVQEATRLRNEATMAYVRGEVPRDQAELPPRLPRASKTPLIATGVVAGTAVLGAAGYLLWRRFVRG